MDRGLSLAELLEILEDDNLGDTNEMDEIDIVLGPPENACGNVTDEDSGDEDTVNVNNLPGSILRAEAELLNSKPSQEISHTGPPRKKTKQHAWVKELRPFPSSTWNSNDEIQEGNDTTPVEEFFLLFNERLISLIVTESNRYANSKNRTGNITSDEVKCFIAILILSGYVQLPRRRMYWEQAKDTHNSLVANAMSRDRFEYIMSNIHFIDNNSIDKDDKFAKVRPLFSALNATFQSHAPIEEHHSIDEAMVPYFGRHSCKQFIRGKPIRYGYKLWVGATRLGYSVWMEPYQGKSTKISEEYKELGLGASVVLEYSNVLDALQKEPYHLYFDNFFTSLHLLEELENKGMKGTGTVRENRLQKCPLLDNTSMKKKERGCYDYRMSQNKNILICKWHDNSVVCLASNACSVEPIHRVTRYSQKEKKRISVSQPHIVHEYNKYMGGVDRCDQNISLYRISIRGKKWYFPLISHCIDMSVQNSWQLHKKRGGSLDHLEYRRRIAIAILSSHGTPRRGTGRPSKGENVDMRYDRLDHFVQHQDKRTRCRICHAKCSTRCSKCDVGLHVQCFTIYHVK